MNHHCSRCPGMDASINEIRGEIVHMLRLANKRPDTQQAINCLARIPELKERLRETQRQLAAHVAEMHPEAS